jgi:DNA-binding NtrC family response regulator
MRVQGTSILIVEDDLEVLNILKEVFENFFNNVHTAINGSVAQEMLADTIPDILLTDIDMPEMNGVDLVIKLRADGINIPVVMMTSNKDREFIIKAVKLGVQDFVEKPFKKKEIEMAIFRSLEIASRNNHIPDLILKFGEESIEVKKQQKRIGLLKAISAQV